MWRAATAGHGAGGCPVSLPVPPRALQAAGTVDALALIPDSPAPGRLSLLTHRLVLQQRCLQPLHQLQQPQDGGQRGSEQVKEELKAQGLRLGRSAGGVMLSMGSLSGAQCSGQVGCAGRSSRHSGTSSVPCRAGGRARPDTARAVQRHGMWDGRYQ